MLWQFVYKLWLLSVVFSMNYNSNKDLQSHSIVSWLKVLDTQKKGKCKFCIKSYSALRRRLPSTCQLLLVTFLNSIIWLWISFDLLFLLLSPTYLPNHVLQANLNLRARSPFLAIYINSYMIWKLQIKLYTREWFSVVLTMRLPK